MPKAIKTLLAILMIPLCFAVGIHAGPYASSAYHKIFPEPEYKTGDYSALYAQAGRDIVLYSTTTCPYCTKVRELFAKEGVKFTEYQIDKSKAAAADFQSRGGQYVPLLYIGEREIAGFREQAIRNALVAVNKKN
jgi:glutaredoxin